jgi:hypothetical protein
VYQLVAGAKGTPEIAVESTSAPDEEPLRRQLESFVEVVRARASPVVGGEDGRRALSLAQTVLTRMAEHPVPS